MKINERTVDTCLSCVNIKSALMIIKMTSSLGNAVWDQIHLESLRDLTTAKHLWQTLMFTVIDHSNKFQGSADKFSCLAKMCENQCLSATAEKYVQVFQNDWLWWKVYMCKSTGPQKHTPCLGVVSEISKLRSQTHLVDAGKTLLLPVEGGVSLGDENTHEKMREGSTDEQ